VVISLNLAGTLPGNESSMVIAAEAGNSREKEKSMKKMLISVAAVALLFGTGVSFAQESTQGGSSATKGSGGQADKTTNYLTDTGTMSKFFTDESMGTMRSADEMKAAYAAMSSEQQAALKDNCKANTDTKFTAFCSSIAGM
jgi:hypothetical protein